MKGGLSRVELPESERLLREGRIKEAQLPGPVSDPQLGDDLIA